MKTIAELFAKKQPVNPDNYGIEFEMEGINRDYRLPHGWRAEEDGSLRYFGKEFVSDVIPFDKAFERLTALKDMLDAAGIRPRLSNLASTHIHIDVRDLNVKKTLNLIGLIMMFEKSIAKASGADRYNNYFALGNSEADLSLIELQNVNSDEEFFHFVHHFAAADLRYSGINYAAIAKYGSLEVRYLGMQENPITAYPWLVFYNHLKEMARDEYFNFDDVYMSISEVGIAGIADKFKCHFPIAEDDILDGIRCAQDVTRPCHYELYGVPEKGNGVLEFYKNN